MKVVEPFSANDEEQEYSPVKNIQMLNKPFEVKGDKQHMKNQMLSQESSELESIDVIVIPIDSNTVVDSCPALSHHNHFSDYPREVQGPPVIVPSHVEDGHKPI